MSEIRATTISDAAGTGPIALTGQSAAKAWVTFNGTSTATILDSFNCGSLTDNGTGSYDVAISSAMSNASYSLVEGSRSYQTYTNRSGANTASNMAVGTANASGSAVDVAYIAMNANGDLA